MTLPDPAHPYGFEDYLRWREELDYFDADPFLQRLVDRYAGSVAPRVVQRIRPIARKASTRWREWSEALALPERRPYLQHWDAHHRRLDRVVRPAEAELLEREVLGLGLFASDRPLLERYLALYLLHQNGEACTACPLVCTEGMIAALERYGERPELQAMLAHLRDGRDGRHALGAQFLTEIQGGSDIQANRMEAVSDGGAWRLSGSKFFCSVAHADYALVTAKPRGSEHVGLFALALFEPGAPFPRNGHTLDRLKWKMGTCELPTAEATFRDALAYAVGPLDQGLQIAAGLVLAISRLTVALASAAYMTRAVREAKGYAEFRKAFGRRLADHPMVAAQLQDLEREARRTTAGAFKLQLAWHAQGSAGTGDAAARLNRLQLRELVLLQKVTAAQDATQVIRRASAILGGHGAMEDFSCLPRLYRDSAVNELWEGPRNVLLAQVFRDLKRYADQVAPSAFVKGILPRTPGARASALAREAERLVLGPGLEAPGSEGRDACRRWDALAADLFHAYQEEALAEIGG